MKGKKKATSANAIEEAKLILKLYELRRESVMRQAPSYIGGEFMPASADEFVQIVSAGGPQSGFVLQVYGYWDMVSAFVQHGALDAGLSMTRVRRCISSTRRSSHIWPEFGRS
jgi:hypothetical protein